jgi:hypothetical protein
LRSILIELKNEAENAIWGQGPATPPCLGRMNFKDARHIPVVCTRCLELLLTRVEDGCILHPCTAKYMNAEQLLLVPLSQDYAVWATMIHHRHQYTVEDFGKYAMPFGR